MTTESTAHLNLPLPHPDNLLETDVERLRHALREIDSHAQQQDLSLAAHNIALANMDASTAYIHEQLSTKAEQATLVALQQSIEKNLSAKADNTALHTLERATTQAQDSANAAHGAATLAQTIANAAKSVTDSVSVSPAAHKIPKAGTDGTLDAGWFGGGGTMPVGHIDLLPFRHTDLPAGWYLCNGDRFANDTPQAVALNALPTQYKADWGINDNGSTTNVPKWAHSDGRMPFMRAVDGASRIVGGVEEDAIRNIFGTVGTGNVAVFNATTGVFGLGTYGGPMGNGGDGGDGYWSFQFNAARVVPTAPENRTLNRGMTPAIYLGV